MSVEFVINTMFLVMFDNSIKLKIPKILLVYKRAFKLDRCVSLTFCRLFTCLIDSLHYQLDLSFYKWQELLFFVKCSEVGVISPMLMM